MPAFGGRPKPPAAGHPRFETGIPARAHGRFVFSVEHPVLTCCDVARAEGQGRTRWIVDDYFLSGPRETHWFGARVQKYHRTVAEYFEQLVGAGFQVQALAEGRPLEQHISDAEELRRRQRVPVVLMFGARRVGREP